ncbi:LacI family DNA-binding transcriptional regulator [Brachybacterium sp. AOP42-B2-9]|uniref:LacI family DNA-binding transcriptional regulator n=1 Tax=Brachybacterium sp. AOP42-B2-9 TaxID=3457672 RepID=UPI0040333036
MASMTGKGASALRGRDSSRRHVTITDVAKAAGVSKAAVSYALNGRAGVSDRTRAHVLSTAERLGWTPSLRARSISLSRAHALGLVVPRPVGSLGSPFLSQAITGIQEVVQPQRLVLLQAMAGDVDAEIEMYRTLAHDGRVDGVFLVDLRKDDPRLPVLEELELPFVAFGPSDEPDSDLVVGSDTEHALREATRMLIDLGHTTFAAVTGPARLTHTPHRVKLIAQELRRAGLPEPVQELGDYTAASGAECTRRVLARSRRPTAVIYANDVMAIGGMGMAHELGYRIPEDLSVLGMEDIELAAHVPPGLTTIRSDSRAVGAEAARRLVARLDSSYVPEPAQLPEPELVRRGSTGPAPTPTS